MFETNAIFAHKNVRDAHFYVHTFFDLYSFRIIHDQFRKNVWIMLDDLILGKSGFIGTGKEWGRATVSKTIGVKRSICGCRIVNSSFAAAAVF
jgi:hypothetical protein